jgi:ribosome biogenesis GTPase
LIRLEGGAFLIDTPGLREIRLWAEEASVESAFDEIAIAAAGCRFPDCSHKAEPGCAVLAAVESGEIEESRWRSYEKLTAEVRQMDKKAIRKLSRQMRQYKQTW